MKVLITGASGFVGAPLARLVVRQGHEVVALLREGSPLGRIQDLEDKIRIVRADLQAVERVEAIARELRPEVCLHLAWYAEPGQYLGSPLNIDLAWASARMALALGRAGCRRFVATGTCFEHDTRLGTLAEDSPVRPAHLYSAAKAALHGMLLQVGAQTGMEVAWARLFYLHGPEEDPRRLIPAVARGLLAGQSVATTDGTQVRDFLHVEDAAAALWAIACSPLAGAVNVGSGVPVTVRQVVETIGRLTGRPDLLQIGARPRPADDPLVVCADPARLVQGTDFRPRYDLEEGLGASVAYWRRTLAGEGARP